MNIIITLLRKGFESSSGKTPEFITFCRAFKKYFTKELKSIGATNIVFSNGHFDITGFFTSESGQIYYISLPDVRGAEFKNNYELMYRTAEHYKDYLGGGNQWAEISEGMATQMNIK